MRTETEQETDLRTRERTIPTNWYLQTGTKGLIGETERQRETKREIHTETERETESDRQREGQTERHREIQRETERGKERHTQ